MKNLILFISIIFSLHSFTLDYKDFGKLPFFSNVTISPDGKKIAALANIESKPYIVVTDFGSTNFNPIASLKNEYDRLEWIEWANNEKIIFQSSKAEKARERIFRVYDLNTIDSNGSNFKIIENKSIYKDKQNSYISKYESISLVDILEDDENKILVSNYDPRERAVAIFEVNLKNNRFKKIESPFIDSDGDRITNFIVSEGKIQFADFYDSDEGVAKVFYRPKKEDNWTEIYRASTEDLATDDFYIGGIDRRDGNLFIYSNFDSNHSYISKFNVDTGQLSDPIYSREDHEIVAFEVEDGEIKMVCYERFSRDCDLFDPEEKAIVRSLEKSFPGHYVNISSYSKDFSRFIATIRNSNSPAKYFAFDKNNGKSFFISSQYPQLENKINSVTKVIEYKSRDGYQLYGFLTLPKGIKRPPIILFPHGGPFARDRIDYFDPWLQAMVAQGYAVFQPQFRGSAGWGKNYQVSGYKETGKKMQNDMIDGFDYVVNNYDLDNKKACMVGASYGGYAALTGSFQSQDKFKCFVSIAGISDFTKLIRSETFFRGSPKMNDIMIGNAFDDKEYLDSVSAINYADKIKRPILLIHGTYDTQVPHNQSELFYNKIKNSNDGVEYFELPKATHYFDEEGNRLIMFREIERFLAENLN